MPYGPDQPKLGDGKSEFDAKHHQGRTVIVTQEGVITRATRVLRPITAASHDGQDWCMRGCGPVMKPEGATMSVGVVQTGDKGDKGKLMAQLHCDPGEQGEPSSDS